MKRIVLSFVLGVFILCPKIFQAAEHKALKLATVTSNGRSGKEWIAELNKQRINMFVHDHLKRDDWKSTTGMLYHPVLLRGDSFSDIERSTSNIRRTAKDLGLITPPMELAPLLREKITDEEIVGLGLWRMIVMSEPRHDNGGNMSVLGLDHRDNEAPWLRAFVENPPQGWVKQDGFVFILPPQ